MMESLSWFGNTFLPVVGGVDNFRADGIMNYEKYRQILIESLCHSSWKASDWKCFLFLHNNNIKHTTNAVIIIFEEKNS